MTRQIADFKMSNNYYKILRTHDLKKNQHDECFMYHVRAGKPSLG